MNLDEMSNEQLLELHNNLLKQQAAAMAQPQEFKLNPRSQGALDAVSPGQPKTAKDLGAAKEILEIDKAGKPSDTAQEKSANLQAIIDKTSILANAYRDMTNQGPSFLPDSFGGKPGRVRGVINSIMGMTGQNPAVKSVEGDRAMNAMGLAQVASGGNAIRSPGMAKMLQPLLPGEGTNWQEFGRDMSTIVHDARAQQAAWNQEDNKKDAYDPVQTQAEIEKMLQVYMPKDEFVKYKQSYTVPGQPAPSAPPTNSAQPPSPLGGPSSSPDPQPFLSDDTKLNIGKSLKGLVAGASIPGEGLASSYFKTPLDLHNMIAAGQKPSIGDVIDLYKKNYQGYNQTIDQWKKDAPISGMIGGIPQTVAEYGIGTKALSGIPLLGESNQSSTIGKLLEVAKKAVRGGAVNTAMGQLSGPDASRMKSDFAWGAGGELGSSALEGIADAMAQGGRNIGGRLNESFLGRPKPQIQAELSKGQNTLGQEMYDRGIWGTEGSMAKQAAQGLDTNDAALQKAIQDAGNGTLSKSFTADQLSELKNHYASIPGRENEVNQIEDLMKKYWNAPAQSLSDANQLKRDLYKQNAKAYDKSINPVRAEADMAAARGIKQGIEAQVPEAKELNQNLSSYGRLSKALSARDAANQKTKILGLGKMLAGGAAAATGITHDDEGYGFDYKRALPIVAGALLGDTAIGKTGSAQSIKLLMNLLQAGAQNSRFIAPIISGGQRQ